jgi:hypothetical protein
MGWIGKVVGAGAGYAIAGPAGALIGARLGSRKSEQGYDLSDVPFGVHVEASHDDDEGGRLWTLRFLSDVPPKAGAEVRLLSDAGQRLGGRAPFADEDGRFTVAAPIHDGECSLYVPWGAVIYASPKYISLEVSVWSAGQGATKRVGLGILDADLPRARPWKVADYWLPIIVLCARITDVGPAGRTLETMVPRLADELEIGPDDDRPGALAAMLKHATKPLSIDDAVQMLQCRFAHVSGAQWLELLTTVCFAGSKGNTAERAKLAEVSALLG